MFYDGTSRKKHVDVLKGFCLCLIIIGHCIIPDLAIRIIYLFHVPMFFFLSGTLYKERPIITECKKAASSLLWPYLLGVLAVGLKYFIDALRGADISSLYLLFVSAFVVGPRIDVMGVTNVQIGAIWFLPALFICRVVFQALNVWARRIPIQKKKNGIEDIVCVVLMAVSFICGLWIKDGSSVLGIGQAVVAMFFYSAGVAFQKKDTMTLNSKYRKCGYMLGLSFVSVFFCESLDLYTLKIPVWWSLFSTVAATIFLVKCARLIEQKRNPLVMFFAVVGKYSVVLLLVHYYEMRTFDWNKINCVGDFLPCIRLAIDVIVFVFLLKIPGVKKILRLS